LGIADDKGQISEITNAGKYIIMQAKTPQEKGAVEFDFAQILCIMQTGHFELIYKLLFREATR
jgi:hypothetical protein